MEGSSIAPFAWFFMLLSMGWVTVLTAYCYIRILSSRDEPVELERPGTDVSDS